MVKSNLLTKIKINLRLKKATFVDLAIIFLVSLIPIIWLSGGYMVLGHDAGTPISPQAHFLDRLFTWTQRYGATGQDQSFAMGAFFVHLPEFLLSAIGLSNSAVQIIIFCSYFACIGLSMYFFAKVYFTDSIITPLFAAVFYMVNHFVLQAWFIAERTKFMTYIFLPLFLAFYYLFFTKKLKLTTTALLLSLFLVLFNGGGFIPVFGAVFMVGGLFAAITIALSQDKFKNILNLIKLVAYVVFLSLFLQMYFVLPYITELKSTFTAEVAKRGSIQGTIDWLNSVSQYTSYGNLLRLQGIQEWYVNAEHPYAFYYINNIFLQIVSWFIPIVAFLPTVICKNNKQKITIISAIAIVSVFFASGSHSPQSAIYIALMRYVPGFLVFRSAFYKFAPGIWFAYALLIGIFAQIVIAKIITKHAFSMTYAKVCAALIVVAYCFPFITGNFFNYTKTLTTKVKVPQYVLDYASFANSPKNTLGRTLLIPPQPKYGYYTQTDWGYWSLAQINSLTDRGAYVDRSYYNSEAEAQIIEALYQALIDKDPNWQIYADKLGIDSVLVRQDIVPPTKTPYYEDESDYFNYLKQTSKLQNVKNFGKWQLYKMQGKKDTGVAKLYSSYNILFSQSLKNPDQIPNFSSNQAYFYLSKPDPNLNKNLLANQIYFASCASCATGLYTEFAPTKPTVLPGSPIYKVKSAVQSLKNKFIKKEPQQLESFFIDFNNSLFELARAIELNSKYIPNTWQNAQNKFSILKHEVEAKYINKTIRNITFDDYIKKTQIVNQLQYYKNFVNSLDYEAKSKAKTDLLNSILALTNKMDIKVLDQNFTQTHTAELNEDGQYELYVKNNNFTNSDITLNINNQNFKVTSQSANWLNFGKANLKAGSQIINISGDLGQTTNLGYVSLSEATKNNYQACKNTSLGTLQPGNYEVYGNLANAILTQQKVNTLAKIDNLNINLQSFNPLLEHPVNLDNKAKKHISNFFSLSKAQNVVLYLCSQDQKFILSTLGLELKITRALTPKIVLVKQNHTNTSKVSYIKLNTNNQTSKTLYTGKNSGIAVIGTKYDSKWQSPTLTHLPYSESGIFNAFYVTGDNKAYNITYTNQKMFVVGSIVSCLSAFFAIVLIIKNLKS